MAIRLQTAAAPTVYSVADVAELCSVMYRNVVKACRTAKQFELAERMCVEAHGMCFAAAAAAASQDSSSPSDAVLPSSSLSFTHTGSMAVPLVLSPDPLLFCEMMIVYKEMDRPWDVLRAAADLFRLKFAAETSDILTAYAAVAEAASPSFPHQRSSRRQRPLTRRAIARGQSSSASKRTPRPASYEQRVRESPVGRLRKPEVDLLTSAAALAQLPTAAGTAGMTTSTRQSGTNKKKNKNNNNKEKAKHVGNDDGMSVAFAFGGSGNAGAAVEGRLLRLLCAARFRLRHWEEVPLLFDVMVQRRLEPTRLVYNLAISACVRRRDADGAARLFDRMLSHCMQPPSEVRWCALAAGLLLSACCCTCTYVSVHLDTSPNRWRSLAEGHCVVDAYSWVGQPWIEYPSFTSCHFYFCCGWCSGAYTCLHR